MEVLEYYSANIWYHPSLIFKEYKKDGHSININNIHNDKNLYNKYRNIVKHQAIAFVFLKGAQKDRCGNLIYDLKSQYARQVDHCPTDLNQALRLLSTHKKQNEDKTEHNRKPSKKTQDDKEEKDE